MSHPFEVLNRDGEQVEIDVEIVPLIKLLWERELDTFNSCQDHDGYVWVEFHGPSATEFLNFVAGQNRELRGHMLHSVPCGVDSPEVFDAWVRQHGWTYSVLPWSGWENDPKIRFLVSVHSPVATWLERRPRWRARRRWIVSLRNVTGAVHAGAGRRLRAYSRSPAASRASPVS